MSTGCKSSHNGFLDVSRSNGGLRISGWISAWDVTVPDTYADAHAHVTNSAREAGSAATHAAANKNMKYNQLFNTHVFFPVAIKTGGTWHHQAVELVREIGRQTTSITGDVRESTFLFQQLSVALQRGNAVSFQNTFITS